MIDKHQRLSRKATHGVSSPRHALLIRAMERLLSAFYKKSNPEEPVHFKRWEHEKIVHLGLADFPLQPPYSAAKDISFSSWDYEKVSNFGLSTSRAVKNLPREQHQPKQNRIDSDEKFTPKISPVKAWKKDQHQISLKNDRPIDDFFKILGYE